MEEQFSGHSHKETGWRHWAVLREGASLSLGGKPEREFRDLFRTRWFIRSFLRGLMHCEQNPNGKRVASLPRRAAVRMMAASWGLGRIGVLLPIGSINVGCGKPETKKTMINSREMPFLPVADGNHLVQTDSKREMRRGMDNDDDFYNEVDADGNIVASYHVWHHLIIYPPQHVNEGREKDLEGRVVARGSKAS